MEKTNDQYQNTDQTLKETNQPHTKQEETNPKDTPFADVATKNQQPGVDLTTQLAEAKEQITALEAQLKDQKLRAFAEEQNIRRRATADVEKAHKYGQESLIKELLPILDSLEQALLSVKLHQEQSQEQHQEEQKKQEQLFHGMIEGIELTMKMLLDSFAKFRIETLDPEGQTFNPQEHEAMAMQPSDKVEANTIIQVVQKGYKLHDRILRPARVIVSK